MDLTEFLLARIAEDSAAAFFASQDEELIGSLAEHAIGQDDHRLTHAARWRPEAVQTHCKARERIVEIHSSGEHGCPSPDAPEDGLWSVTDQDVMQPCPTLRLLALPYAHVPGYREEWRI